jgi:hypothetical protein
MLTIVLIVLTAYVSDINERVAGCR